MKEHEHATKNKPETKPAQNEVAKKANAEGKTPPAGAKPEAKSGGCCG